MATTHVNRLQTGAIQAVKTQAEVTATPAVMKPIEPNDLQEVMAFANIAVRSNYFGMRSLEEAAFRILYGRELGLSAMQSVMGIDIIKGRPGLRAATVASMIDQSGRFLYRVKQWNDEECNIEFFDRGESVGISRFTIDDADRAGLLKGESNWHKYRKAMLFARAITQGARAYCPSIFSGPVYSAEELSDGGTYDGVLEGEIVDPEPPPAETPKTTAKPEKPAKKAEAKPDETTKGDDKPAEMTIGDKVRRIDEWAERAAKAFGESGFANFAMPGTVIEAMQIRLAMSGLIPGKASSYRDRTKEIASIELPWEEIRKHLKAAAAGLSDELKAEQQNAPFDTYTDAEDPREPGADG